MILIRRILKNEGFKSKLILNVHDALVFYTMRSEYMEVTKLAKDVMENIRDLSDDVLPGLDWSWLNVPLVADSEIGKSLGTMVEFDLLTVEAGEEDAMQWLGKNEKGKDDILRKPVNVDELIEQVVWRHKTKSVS